MNEIKTIKELIPIDDQYDTIDKILKEQTNNNELSEELTKKFSEKNLSTRLVSALFGGEAQWSDFSDMAKVTFVETCKNVLKWEILDENKWFDDTTLIEYDNKIIETKTVNSIIVRNAIKIDNNNYLGYVPIGDIYNWFTNTMLPYNYDAQREPQYKSIGTKGRVIKTYSLNDKAVQEISKSIIAGDYEEDMLIYNVLIQNQKNIPQIADKKQFENIYNVEVTPNYDRKSNNYTVVNVLDGWHRTVAGVRAYEECVRQGIEIKAGFPLKLTVRDLAGAQNIVKQIFKRTETDPQWLNGMSDDDYNDFINSIASQSKILKNKLVKTYDEYVATQGSITYLIILREAIEKYAVDIPLDVKVQRRLIAGKFANIIDELIEFFQLKYGNMKTIMNKTHLLDVNIFVGYIAIANVLREIDDYTNYLIKIGEKVCSLTEEELSDLKLINKSASVKKIYNYFEAIAKDVIKDEE